ncbi:AfsR/SARP family transcriptional regulator [Glycomyces artemisiae]|uniref:DNA-binding SARP family transcriptional activator n=1 Tax=Glycomyces artemisiae TaxID=1076443 RepID=A0A2T0UMU0_9ACTN|nr:BTAD domain-containing putative transcriptional regulator [Glycomyces artemisiae]PRY59253.1 DNA-binding SARP family transcriptional activator [Glycomyces artemisiae]
MPTLDVRLLGPLEVRIDGVEAAIPRGKTATILAILLDDANAVVPLEHLIHAVYGYDRPQDPETQIQNAVGVLRLRLGAARDRIETVGRRAYRFRIAAAELDLLRCKEHENLARNLRAEGRPAEAADALRAALAEWRGPALADLSGTAVEAIRRRLDEHRPTLLERRLDLDLELGRAADVVDELRQIVAADGKRQRFTALLMRALHASGRTSEALEAFAALKLLLQEQLGIDPDRDLVDLNAAILRDEPAGTPARIEAPRLVPATLPRAITRFTGRDDEIRALDDALDAADGEAGLAVVAGMGGVGKTALAVRWAHRVAHRFPDGQLYFNLRGFDPLSDGADPAAVLAEALAALGVPAQQLPAGLSERVGLYRTVLARRRVLVVLDNARDAAQVLPLLPVAPGSFTLVTSRDRLTGLAAGEGADAVPLGVMSEADAWALLVRRIGLARAVAEEEPVRRIVAACGRLPLALTLIGAWAAQHPGFSIASLADRLDQTTNVFKVLAAAVPGSDPRSVFACSYQALDSRAAQAFRLFGLHPGPELTPAAMASLMGGPRADAEAALNELAGVHLIEQPRPGRYTMHDLLRAYAKERLAEEVAADLGDAAALRMVEHYLFTASALGPAERSFAFDLGEPSPGVAPETFADPEAAAAWLDAEDEVLRGLIRLDPAGLEADARVWQLGWRLTGLTVDRLRGMEPDAPGRAAPFGRTAARGYSAGPILLAGTEAALTEELNGVTESTLGDAVPGARSLVAYTLTAGAGVDGRDAEAREHARRGEAYFRERGNRYWGNRLRFAIGWHSALLGEYDEARRCYDKVVEDALPERRGLAKANTDIGFGYIAHAEGRFGEAAERYGRALAWFEADRRRVSAAFTREHLGDTLRASGDGPGAREQWTAAAEVYEAFGLASEAARVRAKTAGA